MACETVRTQIMKNISKIAIGLACGITLLVGAGIFYAIHRTDEMVRVADEFLAAMATKDVDEAYQHVVAEFAAVAPKEAALTYFETHEIRGNISTHWSARSVEAGSGFVVGTVTTEAGRKVRALVGFEKRGDDWRISAVQLGQ